MKEAITAANQGVARGETATTQLAAVEKSLRQLDGSVASLSDQFDRLNHAYDPVSVQKMAQEGRLIAAHEARSLIYLIAGVVAGLLILHAVLNRLNDRRRNAKVTRSG
jgi:hypothetical protein